MRRSRFSSETGLAAAVVAWLEEQRWDVYQEVCGAVGRADIVAVQGPIVWVIEAKLAAGLDVLSQAAAWIGHAHRVSVAVPYIGPRAQLFRDIAEWKGIGILEADREDVRETAAAATQRRVAGDLRAQLAPEHKTHARAGTYGGGYWTPFRRTCEAVARAVADRPGLTLKELIDGVATHYASKSSARSSIAHWAERGYIRGVRLERDGAALRLFPSETAA